MTNVFEVMIEWLEDTLARCYNSAVGFSSFRVVGLLFALGISRKVFKEIIRGNIKDGFHKKRTL